MPGSRASRLALLGLLLAVPACENAGANLGLTVSSTGSILVGVYLDRDGSGTQTAVVDTIYAGARVALLANGTTDTLRTAVSDALGLATFTDVPVGEYRIAVAPASIGDSLQVAEIDTADVSLTAGGSNAGVVVRLAFPELSIRQVRGLPAGRRAFIRGVVLAGVQSFRDTTSHLADTSGQLRLTRVMLRAGLTGNPPGDSVSVLGTTSMRNGQPTLDLALISRFGPRPAPIPFAVRTVDASTALGGTLDAALVQVIAAIVSDSATVAPDFHVTASDNSGPIVIILDANQPFQRNQFRVGRSLNVTGVLVPNGAGGWNLKPRATSDLGFNNAP